MSVAGTYHEKALKFGGHLVLATDISSPVSFVDFGPSVLTDTYDSYYFELSDVVPSAVNTHFSVVVSLDGSTFPASNLSWQRNSVFATGASQMAGSLRGGFPQVWHYADFQFQSHGLSGYIGFTKGPPGFNSVTQSRWLIDGISSNIGVQMFNQGGGGSIAGPAKALRFYYDGGTIQSGKIRLYGLVK